VENFKVILYISFRKKITCKSLKRDLDRLSDYIESTHNGDHTLMGWVNDYKKLYAAELSDVDYIQTNSSTEVFSLTTKECVTRVNDKIKDDIVYWRENYRK